MMVIVFLAGGVSGCGGTESAHDKMIVCSGYMESMISDPAQAPRGFLKTATDVAVESISPGATSVKIHTDGWRQAAETYKAQMEPPRAVRLSEDGEHLWKSHLTTEDGRAAGRFVAECERAFSSLSK
jgi:hypothetical protein